MRVDLLVTSKTLYTASDEDFYHTVECSTVLICNLIVSVIEYGLKNGRI